MLVASLQFQHLPCVLARNVCLCGVILPPVTTGSKFIFKSTAIVDTTGCLPISLGWKLHAGSLVCLLDQLICYRWCCSRQDPLESFAPISWLSCPGLCILQGPRGLDCFATLQNKPWPFVQLGLNHLFWKLDSGLQPTWATARSPQGRRNITNAWLTPLPSVMRMPNQADREVLPSYC